MGLGELIDQQPAETPEVVPEVTPEIIPEAAAETPEASEVVEAPEVTAAPAVQEVKEDKSVPLPTFLDMRDRAIAAERRAQELDKPREAPKMPDPIDDPTGHAEFLETRLQSALVAERFESSNEAAREKYGAETVDTAVDWALAKAQADPTFAAQYMRERRPVDWIVRQHQRDGLLSLIGDKSLDDFVKEYVAQNGEKLGLNATVAAPAVAETQQAPATPPRSLASTPSKGGAVKDVPIHGNAALEAVFTR